jgi:hypothetical protein
MAAATTVTDPRSSLRLDRRHADSGKMQCGQQIRLDRNCREDKAAISPYLNSGTARRDTAGSGDRRLLVAARRQPSGLPRGVDAADLLRHRGDAGQTHQENRDQSGDAERRFDGGRTGLVG